jgi:membrane associated rhomboid family serine protease
MILTHRIRSYLISGVLFLAYGIAGIYFWHYRPESPSAHTAAVFGMFFGTVLLVWSLYRLWQYRTRPSLVKQDDKRFGDERLLAIQDRAASFSVQFSALLLIFLILLGDNICDLIFGKTDFVFVLAYHQFIAGILGIIGLSYFVSLIYYYYTRV